MSLEPGFFWGVTDALEMALARERTCPVCNAPPHGTCERDGKAIALVHAERVETLCPLCGESVVRFHACGHCGARRDVRMDIIHRDARPPLCSRCLGELRPTPIGSGYAPCCCEGAGDD